MPEHWQSRAYDLRGLLQTRSTLTPQQTPACRMCPSDSTLTRQASVPKRALPGRHILPLPELRACVHSVPFAREAYSCATGFQEIWEEESKQVLVT